MGRVTAEVRALLQERQDTEHTPLPSRSLLSPRWMGPFRGLARTAPNTYRLDIPATWRIFPEFNVERLRPYRRRPDRLGGPGDSDAGPPPPAAGPDGAVPDARCRSCSKFKMRDGRPYVLVRWAWTLRATRGSRSITSPTGPVIVTAPGPGPGGQQTFA